MSRSTKARAGGGLLLGVGTAIMIGAAVMYNTITAAFARFVIVAVLVLTGALLFVVGGIVLRSDSTGKAPPENLMR